MGSSNLFSEFIWPLTTCHQYYRFHHYYQSNFVQNRIFYHYSHIVRCCIHVCLIINICKWRNWKFTRIVYCLSGSHFLKAVNKNTSQMNIISSLQILTAVHLIWFIWTIVNKITNLKVVYCFVKCLTVKDKCFNLWAKNS